MSVQGEPASLQRLRGLFYLEPLLPEHAVYELGLEGLKIAFESSGFAMICRLWKAQIGGKEG